MRVVPMLALALMIAAAPLRAQATNNSSLSLKPPVTGESGTPADVSVDLSVGTLGVGLQIAKLVTPHVGLRAGASYFSLNRNITQTDVQYDASVKLQSFSGLVDFFPGSRGPFRLTGGVISNQDKVDATGTCSSTIKINGQSYTCSQVGTLSGSVKFPSASPYVGLGFGTPQEALESISSWISEELSGLQTSHSQRPIPAAIHSSRAT